MAIDIEKESLLSLTEATKAIPRVDGKRPNISTVWRWCRRGIKGVRLEYVKIGCRICTSTEALNRFANALAQADRPLRPLRKRSLTGISQRSESEKAEAIKKAESRLKRDGI